MSSRFPRLFSPLQVGPVQVRNRVLSTGHMTCMLEGGLPTDQLVVYHEARARGGCGLIITNLQHEMRASGVEVRLGSAADPDLIASPSPQWVVLATGARPWLPEDLDTEGATMVHAAQVLEGAKRGVASGDRGLAL